MTFQLSKIAYQTMLDRGFIPKFPAEVVKEVADIHSIASTERFTEDLRDLFWISIDNEDTLDIDQLTFVQMNKNGEAKLYVAIAEVATLVKQGSALDKLAAHNGTSVYTPTRVFPMLPPKLSTGLTSLNQDVDRNAIIIEINIGKEGQYALSKIYPALVRNYAKLNYIGVADWLENKNELSVPFGSELLYEQILQQDLLAQHIKKFRYRQGLITFSKAEIEPCCVNDTPVALREITHNRARSMIENFMTVANLCMTKYFLENNIPILKRVIREPKRWDRIASLALRFGEVLPVNPNAKALQNVLLKFRKNIPEQYPHLSLVINKLLGKGEYIVHFPEKQPPPYFDIGFQSYAHTTAPNRRFTDLVMQRLLKSHFNNKPFSYDEELLLIISLHCTQKENDAIRVERRVRKSAIALLISDRIGEQFNAIITGVKNKNYWVKTLSPPFEGKLVSGFEGLDVGDHLKVQLVNVDVMQGFIDFAKI